MKRNIIVLLFLSIIISGCTTKTRTVTVFENKMVCSGKLEYQAFPKYSSNIDEEDYTSYTKWYRLIKNINLHHKKQIENHNKFCKELEGIKNAK